MKFQAPPPGSPADSPVGSPAGSGDVDGHKTVSAAAEKTEKQRQLGQNREDCKRIIQQKQKDVRELTQVMEDLMRSAQAAVEDSEKIFTELIESIERRRSEVKELIRAQEKTELSQALELLKKLEQEIADLRRRDAELEQLSHSEDHIHFLQGYLSLPALPGVTIFYNINTKPQFSIKFVKKLVSEMEQLNWFSKLEIVKISKVHTIRAAEPKTRKEFMKCFCQLTLNPDTMHKNLYLCEGNKQDWCLEGLIGYSRGCSSYVRAVVPLQKEERAVPEVTSVPSAST
ncbi:hypothetical protein SRHO_G00330180 [Serrasalmus rhombeus]